MMMMMNRACGSSSSKLSGEEAAAEAEEPCSRSKIGDFVQVIKSKRRRISSSGLRHLVSWDEIFPLKH